MHCLNECMKSPKAECVQHEKIKSVLPVLALCSRRRFFACVSSGTVPDFFRGGDAGGTSIPHSWDWCWLRKFSTAINISVALTRASSQLTVKVKFLMREIMHRALSAVGFVTGLMVLLKTSSSAAESEVNSERRGKSATRLSTMAATNVVVLSESSAAGMVASAVGVGILYLLSTSAWVSTFRKGDLWKPSGSWSHVHRWWRSTARMCLHIRRLRIKSRHVQVGTIWSSPRLAWWIASLVPLMSKWPLPNTEMSASSICRLALKGSFKDRWNSGGRLWRNSGSSGFGWRHRPDMRRFSSL